MKCFEGICPHPLETWKYCNFLCISSYSETCVLRVMIKKVSFFQEKSASLRKTRGLIFKKSYDEVMKNSWLTENLGWACDYQKILQKSYGKLRTNLCITYEKLTTTLQISYKNIKFVANDVIQETLCQMLSLVEYCRRKITDNWSYKLLKNAFKKWLTIFLRRS